MQINSAFGSALLGIQKGMQGLDRNAAEIASAGQMEGERSPAGPLVESKVHLTQVESSVEVAKAVDDALGTLFDRKA